jgi:HEAT repeat protein
LGRQLSEILELDGANVGWSDLRLLGDVLDLDALALSNPLQESPGELRLCVNLPSQLLSKHCPFGEQSAVRFGARLLRNVGRVGEGRQVIGSTAHRVEQGVVSVRRNAAAALGKIGPVIGQEGLQVLIKALNEPIQVVREDAVIALGRLGEFARPAVPAIEDVLQEGSTFAARSQAAKSLWLLAPQSKTPPRVLLEQLQGDNEPWVAAEVLSEFAAEMGVINEVADLLDEPNPETRLYAAEVLGALGEKAKHTADRLKRLLEDPDEDVREVAKQALQAVEP